MPPLSVAKFLFELDFVGGSATVKTFKDGLMKLHFISVRRLGEELLRVTKQFPLTVIVTLVTTGLLCGIIERPSDLNSRQLVELVMVMTLGIPVTLAFHLLARARNSNKWLPLLSLLPLAAFSVWLHNHFYTTQLIRYFQWALYCHLLVAIAPYLVRRSEVSFWNFNYKIFIGFFISRFFGLFLWGGLSLGVLAIVHLLEVKVHDRVYGHLGVLCVFLVSTLHFLGLVPDLREEVKDTQPPKLLKIFCQYVLVPLNAAYIVILYMYMIKILVSGDWPKGIIALLVSGVAILGVFALLMMSAFFADRENGWMIKFQKIYYLSVIPLLVMGLVSISKRIEQYSFTEKRYILIVLSVWLIGIASYFLISKAKQIAIIPVSLFVVVFLTSFGPWGFYQVSLRSQVARLKEMLHENPPDKELASGKGREIRDAIVYILSNHGPEYLPSEIPSGKLRGFDDGQFYQTRRDVETFLVETYRLPKNYFSDLASESSGSYHNYSQNFFVTKNMYLFYVGSYKGSFKDDEKDFKFEINSETGQATLSESGQVLITWNVFPKMDDYEKAVTKAKNLSWAESNDKVEVFLIPQYFERGSIDNALRGFSGWLLVKILK